MTGAKPPANRAWLRRAIGWPLYGALSGAAASAAMAWTERLRIDGLMDPTFFVAPGLFFGVVVGVMLYRGGQASAWSALAFAAISVAAWPAAYHTARILAQIGLAAPYLVNYALIGLAGGLVWSAMLTGAAAFLFDFARSRRLWLALLIAGGLAGAVLVAPLDHWGRMGGSVVIFIIIWGGWYATWAAVFSSALPVEEEAGP